MTLGFAVVSLGSADPLRLPLAGARAHGDLRLDPADHLLPPPPPTIPASARLFAFLAPTTLGLYLIHPMFREILYYPYPLRDCLATHLHMGFLWKCNPSTR